MYRNRSMKITQLSYPMLTPVGYGDEEKPEAEGDGGDDLQAQITAEVSKATEGLSKTNKALKDEKKALKERLDALAGQLEMLGGEAGIKQLAEQRKKLLETEEGKLLAEGKHQEWHELKLKSYKQNHENQLTALQKNIDEATARATAAEKKLQKNLLKSSVAEARSAAKTLDSVGVQEDILNAAEKVFEYDPEYDAMVIKDKDEGVVFGKDGKTPKTVTEWLNEQQEPRRHWWPDSVSGGAQGSKKVHGIEKNPWSPEHWNVTEQGRVLRERGADVANKLAASAGSRVGATRPAAVKS